MGKRLAVLVGCNYPNTRFRLRGCVNDVQDMGKLLREKFAFATSDIKVLTDEAFEPGSDLPTGENIMNALKWMVDQAKQGDVLFFHFSGHGTLVTSLESGRYMEHEAIVPCDLNLILDLDLRKFIIQLESGTSFIILSDSCHSGGLIEKDHEQIGRYSDDNQIQPPDRLMTNKAISFGSILQYLPMVIETAINAYQTFHGKKEISLKFKSEEDNVSLPRSLDEHEGILLSGCEKDETSSDVVQGRKPHGAFTNAVIKVLREMNHADGISNRELVKKAREILKAEQFQQHACLYCSDENADANFLSSCTPSRYSKDIITPISLNDDLRRYIIHYGQRAAAVRDLFKDINGKSSLEIDSLGLKEKFFEKACLVKGNEFEYKVTDFIHAGSNHVESAWFGYVAVSTDRGTAALGRRDILVVWRGTTTITEWINNAKVLLKPASHLFQDYNQNVKVHSGFVDLYTGRRPYSAHNDGLSARDQVLNAVRQLVNEYQQKQEDISITITGFSLGAAVATLNAMDIVANGYNKPEGNQNKFTVTAYVFGGPRVGNAGFKDVYEKLKHQGLQILRIVNSIDIVPRLPPSFFLGYKHLGDALEIDTSRSNHLNLALLRDLPNEELEPLCDFPDEEHESELDKLLRDLPSGSISEEEISTSGLNDRGLSFISAHNMEVHLHGVAIKGNVEVDRERIYHDIALVNKHLDLLKRDYKIPPNWWHSVNREKMHQKEDGRWEFHG